MATPMLGKEGARIACGPDWAAVSCRTDNAGTKVGLEVALNPSFTRGVHRSDDGHADSAEGDLTAANLYTAVAYVGGLQPNTRYYWRVYAHDGAGNEVLGSGYLHSNTFVTDPDGSTTCEWKVGITSCIGTEQLGRNANEAKRTSIRLKNTIDLGLRKFLFIGDIVYPDQSAGNEFGLIRGPDPNVAPFADNAYYAWTKTGGGDESKERYATDQKTTLDGNLYAGQSGDVPSQWSFGHLAAAVPFQTITDDHDAGVNDNARWAHHAMSGEWWYDEGTMAKLDIGFQMWRSWWGDCNRYYVERDTQAGVARTFGAWNDLTPLHSDVGPEEYFCIDMPTGPGSGVRFLVIDARNQRDHSNVNRGGPDSETKRCLYYGASLPAAADSQEGWFRDKVQTLPTGWFIAVVSQIEFDGNHGWSEGGTGTDNDWGWKAFSYQRERLFDYIRDAGLANRAVLISGDTHSSTVTRYSDPNKKRNAPDLWEFMSGNFWNSGVDVVTGFSLRAEDSLWRPGEARGAVGHGGIPSIQRAGSTVLTVVEGGPGYMRVQQVEVYEGHGYSGPKGSQVVYERVYQ